MSNDPVKHLVSLCPEFHSSFFSFSHSRDTTDPEDLWDFGTVRHVATVGRSQPNPVQVSGPPLTWENNSNTSSSSNNGTSRSNHSTSSSGSGYSRAESSNRTSLASSVTAKGDLPPLPNAPPPTPKKYDQQATIRHGVLARESSDEYDDDYEDHVVAETVPVDDELPDTTMLDSVVLPAIASVCFFIIIARSRTVHLSQPFSLIH